MEEKKEKWTLKNFFGATKRFKWWVIGACVVGLLGGFLVFKFAINPSRTTYTSQFTYNINVTPTDEKNKISYYADGTVYNYTDIITDKNVEKVKNSKEEYANINTADMLKKGNLSVSKIVDEKEGEYLQVQVKGKYFSSDDQGIAFVSDLVESQLTIAARANDNYNIPNYINDSINSLELLSRVEALDSQYVAINNAYSSFFSTYSVLATKEVSGGENMYDKFNNHKSRFSDGGTTVFERLKADIINKSYADVKDSDTKAGLVADFKEKGLVALNSLRSGIVQEAQLTKTLEAMMSQSVILEQLDSNYTYVVNQLSSVKSTNKSLANYLYYIGYDLPVEVTIANVDTIEMSTSHGIVNVLSGYDEAQFADWKARSKSFTNSLNSYKEQLTDSIAIYRSSYSTLLNVHNNSVSFRTPGKVSVGSGFSSILGGVIGFLVFFIVSEIAVTAVYIYGSKEKKDGAAK